MFDLDRLVADYIDANHGWPTLTRSAGRGDWLPDTLHATDLTKCPRQVAMRLRGDKREPFYPPEVRRFWAANHQHELIYAALDHAGLLVSKEIPVDMGEGWSATADMVVMQYHNQVGGEMRMHVSDSKNSHPNTIRYYPDYPKPDDIFQVSVYAAFIHFEVEDEGEVYYMPLGGAGESKLTRFELVPKHLIKLRMHRYEDVRADLPVIPDVLELEIRWAGKGEGSSRRMNRNIAGGDIVLGKSWQCKYCRYNCSNRNEPAAALAKVSTAKQQQTVTLTSKGRRYEDEIAQFLEDDARKVTG